MSQDITLKLRINLPLLIILVGLLHLLLFFASMPEWTTKRVAEDNHVSTPFKVRDIRTVGSREAKRKDSVYVFKGKEDKKVADKQPEVKENLSLKDLAEQMSLAQNQPNPTKEKPQPTEARVEYQRPGSRPEPRKKALEAVKLSGDQMRNYANNAPVQEAFRGDPRAAGVNTSDIAVNLEVPEGVSPDELNKYELMFYGFQRRTAINYINSFYKNLDKFRRANPHLEFPMTKDMQVMTGRITYDEKGNIKKIKMVQWTNIDKLQNFFVDVLKDMDTLHNPPQALWEKNGEFSIYFSLIVNG